MHPLALEFQEAVLDLARRKGEAETFLRRTVKHTIEFEGKRLRTSQIRSDEFSLRILVENREGITGTTILAPSGRERIAARAYHSSATGRRLSSLHFVEQGKTLAEPRTGSPLEHTIGAAHELLSGLQKAWPDAEWTGAISCGTTETRVCNDSGSDIRFIYEAWTITTRSRSASPKPISDSITSVEADTAAQAVESTLFRLREEVFQVPTSFSSKPCSVVILGPRVVAEVLCAISARAALRKKIPLNPTITVIDEGRSSGYDDEGVKAATVTLIQNGDLASAWTTGGHDSLTPTGRAVRSSVERPPRLRAFSLRWISPSLEYPKRAVFIPELAAATLRDDGVLSGTPVRAIVCQHGQPTARYSKPKGVNISIFQALSNRFLGTVSPNVAVGAHRVPSVAVEMEI